MSRAHLVIAFALVSLVGCGSAPPPQPSPAMQTPNPEIADYHALRDWLDLQQAVSVMSEEQVAEELVKIGEPHESTAWFYVALLNQQLNSYDSWVLARDALQVLIESEGLTGGQRQLADIFMRYNQKRINWYLAYQDASEERAAVEQQLQEAREQNTVLEQKIQAITDLETTISTRKEQ